ncbi:MAG: RNA-binding protein, partial [Candidatus Heimdallarchaeota archaeon]|nr:RNA-binding protein [Candidatus Heimdallarchaeota archaeon]
MGDNYVISEIEKDHILFLLEQNKRSDNRELNQIREINIETHYVGKAEGSAVVTLGDTKLIVGVKAILGSPFPDTPNTGVITTSAELSPLASPYFESG